MNMNMQKCVYNSGKNSRCRRFRGHLGTRQAPINTIIRLITTLQSIHSISIILQVQILYLELFFSYTVYSSTGSCLTTNLQVAVPSKNCCSSNLGSVINTYYLTFTNQVSNSVNQNVFPLTFHTSVWTWPLGSRLLIGNRSHLQVKYCTRTRTRTPTSGIYMIPTNTHLYSQYNPWVPLHSSLCTLRCLLVNLQ